MSHQIAVVYFSGYGHTERLAQTLAGEINAHLCKIDANGDLSQDDWTTLANSDAIIMGSPTYMGSVAWQFKKFADQSSKVWMQQGWKGKLFAGFTNSATMNGDKLSTLHYLFTLAMQHGGIWVGTGLMPSNQKSSSRDDINYVGSSSGLMTTTPSDAGVDEMVAGDLATAKLFAKHVANTLHQIKQA
jgi:NAD(P)H dehydrogenase (quinone)